MYDEETQGTLRTILSKSLPLHTPLVDRLTGLEVAL